jgi:uncharacterized spore protein YtfJ
MTTLLEQGERISISGKNGNARDLESLIKSLGFKPDKELVFYAPIERQGMAIIPVARVYYGLGGGVNTPKGADMRPSLGGGAGVRMLPAGFITIKEGKVTYKPIVDPAQMLRIMLVFNVVIVALGLLGKVQAGKVAQKDKKTPQTVIVNNPFGKLNLPDLKLGSKDGLAALRSFSRHKSAL